LGLLFLEASVKPSLAIPDCVMILLVSMFFKSPFNGISCGFVMLYSFSEMLRQDSVLASAARGHRILTDGIQWLGGNMTFGTAGVFSDLVNKVHDNFWHWAIPAMIVVGLLKKQHAKIWFLFTAIVAADLLRTEVNSVNMTWPFTILLALCLNEKR
jgi:uncharacterized membrane protein